MNIEANKGLTAEQVKIRIENGLGNDKGEVKTKSILHIIADNVFTLFNLVNFIMALSILMVHSYKNMMFAGVVFWNIFIGVFQEVRSKRTIDKMSIISQPKATVLRDGSECIINHKDIVMDDIMILRSGNQVCSDSIVISGKCLVNESLLTGESDPIEKKQGDEIYSGSIVMNGSIKAKVNHVGKDNYVSKITEKVKYLKKSNSEMMHSVKLIIKVISCCIVPLSALLLYHQLNVTQNGIRGAIINTVAAIIGTMPSGLVLLTTMVLEVGVIRLSKYNTLVQDMYCIETLARVDVLCLDKTGTITEGNMIVEDVIPYGDNSKEEINQIMSAFAFNMDDKNPTLDAIRQHFNSETDWKADKCIPFSSDNKWSLVHFDEYGCCIMGAAEFILKDKIDEYKNTVELYSDQGYRVITIAHSQNEIGLNNTLPSDINVVGFILLKDKIRENAADTLQYFDEQGVDIKIISGDNPLTVMHTAKDAGVKNADKYIDASKIKTDEELSQAVMNNTIFGRVTPEQKLKIIEELHNAGHVTAMTGDGVNDVMALKEADCSIAMQSGSDAAKNVSQMILLDSDFSSMPKIVAEGRKSINNMERSATLYLVKTMYSFILAIVFSIINVPYPFSPIQLTLIGALAIGIPSFILAMEPNTDRVKGRFITNVMKKAIPGALGIIANVIVAIMIAKEVNADYTELSTLAAYLTAMASMMVLFDLCRPMNKLRFSMVTTLTVVFVMAFRFFKPLFCVTTVNWELIVVLAAVGTMTYYFHKVFVWLINRIMVG